MIIDTHVHLWDPTVLSYPWLSEQPLLNRPMLPVDLDDADGAVTAMIFVEADAAAGSEQAEVQWVRGLAVPQLIGIVAAADLRAATVADKLDRLRSDGLVCGVRHQLQNEHGGWAEDKAFLQGMRELAARDLSFDACVEHQQLAHLADLVERLGDQAPRIVIDHLGKPPVDAGTESEQGREWQRQLRRLAVHPEVYVKLSGLAPQSNDPRRYLDQAPQFVAVGIDAFGTARCLLGSDQPVSSHLGVGTDMNRWMTLIRRAVPTEDGWQDICAVAPDALLPLGLR